MASSFSIQAVRSWGNFANKDIWHIEKKYAKYRDYLCRLFFLRWTLPALNMALWHTGNNQFICCDIFGNG